MISAMKVAASAAVMRRVRVWVGVVVAVEIDENGRWRAIHMG